MRVKPIAKSAKVHASMTSMQFRMVRELMRFSLVELSIVTKIPYRTLQDYEYGKRSIPAMVVEQLRQEYKRERRIMNQILRGIEKRIDQELPAGFASEVERDLETE